MEHAADDPPRGATGAWARTRMHAPIAYPLWFHVVIILGYLLNR